METVHVRRAVWTLALIAALCLSSAASAQDHRSQFGKGKQYVGLSVGFGKGFSLGFAGDGDGKDVKFVDLRPRYGVGISDVVGEGAWYRGNLDFMLEGEFLFDVDGGTYTGLTAMLRYNFLSHERFIPFVEAGSGIGNLDFGLHDQDDGVSFSPQGGVGFHYFVAEQVSVDGAVRYHHISNAGTHLPNNSINDANFSLGFTYYLDRP